MKINRLLAGAITAGLLGVTPLAATAPANATENFTTVTAAQPSATKLVYGSDFYVSVDVAGSDGYNTYKGTTTLFAMRAGSSVWEPVATAAANQSYYDVKPRMNTTYKVLYSGYAAASAYEDNYAASESTPFSVSVARRLTTKNPRGTFLKGKVAPKYKKKKVHIFKKTGGKWKKFRTLRTNKRSAFALTFPASRRKTFFKIVIKGNRQFAATKMNVSTIRYRSVAPRASIGR